MTPDNPCPGCDLPLDHCRCIQRGSDPREHPAARALAHAEPHWENATTNAQVLAAMQQLRQWLADQHPRRLEVAAARLLVAMQQATATP